MKLSCNCNSCYRQVTLSSDAKSRQQLANTWGLVFTINCPYCQVQNQVHVNAVTAETTRNAAPVPAVVIGGLIGILAGPLGILIGSSIGGATGGVVRSKDNEAVRNFNMYYL